MRFVASGPNIPDDLLISRDAGEVIFFCGAGVSQAEADLPNFSKLSAKVIEFLGAAQNSPARALLEKALHIGHMDGVGGLVSTDRVFSLLEREFVTSDVRAAVAEAIRPQSNKKLDAHQTLIDLATSRAGVTRLVTTNFDRLFEDCDASLPSWGPPRLPDPSSEREFRGVMHLHGRVDKEYKVAQDDEFVISSADFGRAYLSDAWATRFIQSLLKRYQIVFVGYAADDPPIQYLLEALNLQPGSRNRLFAFQGGKEESASALWEHRGVQAIPFDSADGYSALWDTLRAWAERARDVDGWYKKVIANAAGGPENLEPFERGQVAHIFSTREGTRRVAASNVGLDPKWLLVLDSTHRYGTPQPMDIYDEASETVDPFLSLCLDVDETPEPSDRYDRYSARKVPDGALNILKPNQLDYEYVKGASTGSLFGEFSQAHASMPTRLAQIGFWLSPLAHHPETLWWAAQQSNLHPDIQRQIEHSLRQNASLFSNAIRQGWRILLSSWGDVRPDADRQLFEIRRRTQQDGWSTALVREIAQIYRPRIKVRQAFAIPHPLVWSEIGCPERVISVTVDYPRPHEVLSLPDDQLTYAASQFRQNLELAIALEREVSGRENLYFETSRAGDDSPELPDDSYGLTGPIIQFQKLMERLATVNPSDARAEIFRWPSEDDHVFARLRIWAASSPVLSASEATAIFQSLSDNAFWGSLHERDLLFSIRDRWASMSEDNRKLLEQRLLTGSFPWDQNVPGGRESATAYQRLNRLHWLSRKGVKFTFDSSAAMGDLRSVAPDWTTSAGDDVANRVPTAAYRISSNTNPEPLLDIPISEVLSQSEDDQIDFRKKVLLAPFRGLSEQRPVRALAALGYKAREGEAPAWAWSAFLNLDARKNDRRRMIIVIAERLIRLPPNAMREAIYPVSEWLNHIEDRLHGDLAQLLEPLWNKVIEALKIKDGEHHRPGRSWADEALNGPVRSLVDFVLKDPDTQGLEEKAGFPTIWTDRLDQLLTLPGNLRRHALVLIGYQTVWLHAVDPVWTEESLLPAAGHGDDDGEAIWDGILWAGRRPSEELFRRLRPGFILRASRPLRQSLHGKALAALLLIEWGEKDEENAGSQGAISDTDLREVLIHGDDELRSDMLWLLKKWSSEHPEQWRQLILPFFKNVWPKQRALRTPLISARLASFALQSDDLMPALTVVILPRLIPIQDKFMPDLIPNGNRDHPASKYPNATLDLLWVVLGEDPALWPYKIEEVLDNLAQSPETNSDPRLFELKRRRDW